MQSTNNEFLSRNKIGSHSNKSHAVAIFVRKHCARRGEICPQQATNWYFTCEFIPSHDTLFSVYCLHSLYRQKNWCSWINFRNSLSIFQVSLTRLTIEMGGGGGGGEETLIGWMSDCECYIARSSSSKFVLVSACGMRRAPPSLGSWIFRCLFVFVSFITLNDLAHSERRRETKQTWINDNIEVAVAPPGICENGRLQTVRTADVFSLEKIAFFLQALLEKDQSRDEID